MVVTLRHPQTHCRRTRHRHDRPSISPFYRARRSTNDDVVEPWERLRFRWKWEMCWKIAKNVCLKKWQKYKPGLGLLDDGALHGEDGRLDRVCDCRPHFDWLISNSFDWRGINCKIVSKLYWFMTACLDWKVASEIVNLTHCMATKMAQKTFTDVQQIKIRMFCR